MCGHGIRRYYDGRENCDLMRVRCRDVGCLEVDPPVRLSQGFGSKCLDMPEAIGFEHERGGGAPVAIFTDQGELQLARCAASDESCSSPTVGVVGVFSKLHATWISTARGENSKLR